MEAYSIRRDCRLCHGQLETVVDLGMVYLSDFVDEGQEVDKAPLELVRCVDCNLVQLRHTVDQNKMYRNYWYQSGLNQSMVKALADVVQRVKDNVDLKPGDVVLDIGANDGTLLTNYTEHGVIKVACEPSNLAYLAENKADVVINDYFTAEGYYTRLAKPAKVITAIAMFYDLEHPHSFVDDLANVLAHDGVIVIQMMDLLSMLKYGDFPNICHEHLEYYSLRRFCELMDEHGLEVFDLEYNGVNGGSLRAYVRHKTYYRPAPGVNTGLRANTFYLSYPVVLKALEEEDAFFAETDRFAEFRERIERTRKAIVAFVRQAVTLGQRVAVFGASTKGNTVLQYFGLTHADIEHAAEVNPDKFGKRTIGSNIPIVSEAESLASYPDYYLILPWGFIDMFVRKLTPYMENGGMLIVPLPEPRLLYITSDGQEASVEVKHLDA